MISEIAVEPVHSFVAELGRQKSCTEQVPPLARVSDVEDWVPEWMKRAENVQRTDLDIENRTPRATVRSKSRSECGKPSKLDRKDPKILVADVSDCRQVLHTKVHSCDRHSNSRESFQTLQIRYLSFVLEPQRGQSWWSSYYLALYFHSEADFLLQEVLWM